ncbi:uncharacterized protein LOC125758534 [Rhipicephalus sanguineus]|uniref:uncharacterized protein LOC125758534 n=1 Tax=Rhipicephalus sanguineus TaxID=34632 RepID=UPI0020C421FE|nr:uncharacterized protein LOC125758534 [Rhipicephalus sanguineus]
MDPAWEVAAFQRQIDIRLADRRADSTTVSVREASSRQARPVWWRRQLFWMLAVVACMLVLLVLAAYQLQPKRTRNFAALVSVARHTATTAAWSYNTTGHDANDTVTLPS